MVRRFSSDQFGQRAPRPRGGEFVVATGDPEVGRSVSEHPRFGLSQAGHGGADESQQACSAGLAHLRLQCVAGGQDVDIRLAQRDVIGAGNSQAQHGPGVGDVV